MTRRLFENGAGKGHSKINPHKAPLIGSLYKKFAPTHLHQGMKDAPVRLWWRKEIRKFLKKRGQAKMQKYDPVALQKRIAAHDDLVGGSFLHAMRKAGPKFEGRSPIGSVLGEMADGRVGVEEAVDQLLEVFINLGKPKSPAGKKPKQVRIAGETWSDQGGAMRELIHSRARRRMAWKENDREQAKRHDIPGLFHPLPQLAYKAAGMLPGPIGLGVGMANIVRAARKKPDPSARQWPLTPKPRLVDHLRDILRSETGQADVRQTLRMARAGLF